MRVLIHVLSCSQPLFRIILSYPRANFRKLIILPSLNTSQVAARTLDVHTVDPTLDADVKRFLSW
jgi:hypothetical protein